MATASCRRDEALTGHSDRHHVDSVPIKPEQLAALLDALREAAKRSCIWLSRWWACLIFALLSLGFFGLMRGGCMWAT